MTSTKMNRRGRERSRSPSKKTWRESRLMVKRSLIRLSPRAKQEDGSFPTFHHEAPPSDAKVQAVSSIEKNIGTVDHRVPSIDRNPDSYEKDSKSESESGCSSVVSNTNEKLVVGSPLAKPATGNHVDDNTLKHATVKTAYVTYVEVNESVPARNITTTTPKSSKSRVVAASAPAVIVIDRDKKEHRKSPPRPNKGFISKAIISGGKNPNVGASVVQVQQEFETHKAQTTKVRHAATDEDGDDNNGARRGWIVAILTFVVVLLILFLAARGRHVDKQADESECVNATSDDAIPTFPMSSTRSRAESVAISGMSFTPHHTNIFSTSLQEALPSKVAPMTSSSNATFVVKVHANAAAPDKSTSSLQSASNASENDLNFIISNATTEPLNSNDAASIAEPQLSDEPQSSPQRIKTTQSVSKALTVTQELIALITHFSTPTKHLLTDNSTTPQQKALDWLAANEYVEDYPPWKRLQRFALGTLYYSTNGDGWFLNDGWLTDNDECTWVSRNLLSPNCDDEGRMVSLYLDMNGLANGTIPSELVLLSSLTHLQLSGGAWNSFLSGTIPNDLFSLTNLVSLHLQSNRLEGSIPNRLERLTALQTLNLENNRLTGTIPSQLERLTNLKALKIGNNVMVGSIPSEVGLLTNLQEVKFHNNEIVLSIPTQMGLLPKLKSFWSFGNKHTGAIPSEVGLMSNVRDLRLNDNSLHLLPSEIGLLRSLTSLDISRNSLKGSIPSELGALTNLTDLDLSANSLTGSIPLSSFGNLTSLRGIDRCAVLSSVGVEIPCETVYSSPLKRYSGGLRLHNNRLVGTITIPNMLLTDLRFLSLFGNKLSGSFDCPESISQCLISCSKADKKCRVLKRGWLSVFG